MAAITELPEGNTVSHDTRHAPKRRGRRPRADVKSAQINIRMEPNLKAAGDAVLERLGMRPSDAVRALYEYLVREQRIPEELVIDASSNGAASWTAEWAGCVPRMLEQLSGASVSGEGPQEADTALRAAAYHARLGNNEQVEG